ncbi:MAG: hypothetical protein BWK80_19395 [Desulfobacteraceae bacterium IS3]|nr:MAG: hypothetical protein BWK80_19395 [Desulfobacteraceae bacterium IS3]
MSHDGYIVPDEVRLFLDEDLRKNAYYAAKKLLKDSPPKDKKNKIHVGRSQLHSIPAVIQANGLKGLEYLIERQRDKSIKEDKKEKDDRQVFWEFLFDLFVEDPGPKFSPRSCIKSQSQVEKLIEGNEFLMEEYVIPVYFEHFKCHYFYIASMEQNHEQLK